MLLGTELALHHIIWYYNIFFYLFVVELIFTTIISITYVKRMRLRASEMKLIQQQQIAKIDSIRKDHSDVMEKIRVEMLKHEEDRSRQWMESERETLHVLGGVSNLLDLSEKINRVESDKIMTMLQEIHEKVKKITTNK